ncbi:MAG: translation initiation factor IF-2 associated domain-containing protein, partial [Thiobacillus sp.]|nr:translation initiation factor IF-2 associated domain-containing protein [Thiobacillus sp.]
MNVEQFAQELKLPPLLLLEQLKAAGVSKNDIADTMSEADKSHLLDYLRKVHGGGAEVSKTKITITRKQTGEIRKTDSTGKSRTIQVETRKSRTYVKRDAGSPAAEAQPVAEIVEEALAAPLIEEVAPPVVETQAETVPVAAPEPEAVAEPVEVKAEVKPAPAEPVVAEPVAAAIAPAEVVAEAAPVEAAAQPEAEAAPVVKKATRIIKKASILNDAEVKAREDEARRHTALQERQAADSKARAELIVMRKQAEAAREAAKLVAAQKAAAPAAPAPVAPTEKTLHKPDKPGVTKAAKGPDKKPAGAWKDDSARRKGGLKTRGGAAPDTGWRGRKGKSRSGQDDSNFIEPTEMVVR